MRRRRSGERAPTPPLLGALPARPSRASAVRPSWSAAPLRRSIASACATMPRRLPSTNAIRSDCSGRSADTRPRRRRQWKMRAPTRGFSGPACGPTSRARGGGCSFWGGGRGGGGHPSGGGGAGGRARLRPDQSRAWRWLFLVAWREGWRLHRIEARDAERTAGLPALERLDDRRLDPEPSVALRDALARLRPRQRRLLSMQAAGLTYGEIAAATGDSLRTVDRQLVRSRAALRAALET